MTTNNPQEIIDRAPPHSDDAESGFLGAMLLKPELIDDARRVLGADEFASPGARAVYGAMLSLNAEGKRPDAGIIVERLDRDGNLHLIGGVSYLIDAANSEPLADNWTWRAATIRERAIERELKAACLEGANRADDKTLSAQEKIERTEQALLGIAERRTTSQSVTLSTALNETMTAISDRMEHGIPSGLSTGLRDLDKPLGGLRAGELIVVAARPGAGKTSLGTGIATHVAEDGAGVLFVSLEMSRRELCERMLSSRSDIDGEAIREGRLDEGKCRELIEAQAKLDGLPIVLEDSPRRTVLDVVSSARRLRRQGKLALVVVDYLSLIEPENGRDPRQEQVAKLARRLKTAARELQVPILCLAQLNRESEKGSDHRPKLSHLRESGAIEQDADVVLFVHRSEMYTPDDADLCGKAEIIIAKNRNGSTGIVPVVWNARTTTFLAAAANGEHWKGID